MSDSKPRSDQAIDYPLRLLWDYLFQHYDKTVYFVHEPTGEYTLVSEQLAAVLGIPAYAMVGHTDEELLSTGGRQLQETHQWVVNHRRSLIDEIISIESFDLGKRWLVVTKVPVFARNRDLVAIVGSYRIPMIPLGMSQCLGEMSLALRHFRDHISEPHSVKSLSAIAGLSPSHFERRMKQIFGLTTSDFIINQRMVLGKDLLRYTDDGIQIIAAVCGYASNSSFTRQFKTCVGTTPILYRDAEKAKLALEFGLD